MHRKTKYLFVIDTNHYAGNFERAMTAYTTGCVGECGVGAEMAEIFNKDFPENDDLFSNVISVSDDSGCERPATIWPNPRYRNDGMGNHFLVKNINHKKLCKIYVKSQEDYWLPLIKQKEIIIKDLKAGKSMAGWSIEAAEAEIKRHKKQIEKAKKLKKISCCPAYMSVGIWFETKPSKNQIKIMRERAGKFLDVYAKECKEYGYDKEKGLSIEGFRLVKVETKQVTREI